MVGNAEDWFSRITAHLFPSMCSPTHHMFLIRCTLFCLFILQFHIPVNSFSVILGHGISFLVVYQYKRECVGGGGGDYKMSCPRTHLHISGV